MLLRSPSTATEVARLFLPAIPLLLMASVAGVLSSESPSAPSGEQMPPSAAMMPAGGLPPSSGNVELQEQESQQGGPMMSSDKRGWSDMQHGWGKRGWADLRSAWGKRGWKDLQSGWGKRDWNSFRGAWGKRGSWDNFKGSWGKRAGTEWGGGYPQEGYPPMMTEEDSEEEYEDEMGPLERLRDLEYSLGATIDRGGYPEPTEGKRSWANLKGAWGKRGSMEDEEDGDGYEKRAWKNFKGSWGKRDPGWHNLKGLWGKRSPAGKWNKLTSVWGKRSIGGETGVKTEDAPSAAGV